MIFVNRFINRQRYLEILKNFEDRLVLTAAPCPKGGEHVFGIDGAHTNEFCKKCYTDSAGEIDAQEHILQRNRIAQVIQFRQDSFRAAQV